MKKARKGTLYIEVGGTDGVVRVSVEPAKLRAVGQIALHMAAEAAALLAHNGAKPDELRAAEGE